MVLYKEYLWDICRVEYKDVSEDRDISSFAVYFWLGFINGGHIRIWWRTEVELGWSVYFCNAFSTGSMLLIKGKFPVKWHSPHNVPWILQLISFSCLFKPRDGNVSPILVTLHHSLLLSVRHVLTYVTCPFPSLSNFPICVHHLLLTGATAYIPRSVIWQFKFLPSCDDTILNMWSLRLLMKWIQCEQGFMVSTIHAVIIAHISLVKPSHMAPT